MISVFDFKNFNQASAFFDETKLEWMNGEYIRKMSDEDLTERLQEFLVDLSGGVLAKSDHPTEEEIRKIVPLIKERIKKLSDFIPLTDFLWEKPEYDIEVFNKLKIDDLGYGVKNIIGVMEKMDTPWSSDVFEESFRKMAESLGISVTQMFQLIRVCISGQTVTPPLFESIKILGEEETLKRVQKALQFIA